jgi:hypothetical protein
MFRRVAIFIETDDNRSSLIYFSKGFTFNEIKITIPDPPADRTLHDDFQHLKRLGLV